MSLDYYHNFVPLYDDNTFDLIINKPGFIQAANEIIKDDDFKTIEYHFTELYNYNTNVNNIVDALVYYREQLKARVEVVELYKPFTNGQQKFIAINGYGAGDDMYELDLHIQIINFYIKVNRYLLNPNNKGEV